MQHVTPQEVNVYIANMILVTNMSVAVEGIYLLRRVPDVPSHYLNPMPFPPKSLEKIRKCVSEIFQSERTTSEEKAWWREWLRIAMPRSDSADDYVAQLSEVLPAPTQVEEWRDPDDEDSELMPTRPRYHIPLAMSLLDSRVIYSHTSWTRSLINELEDLENEIEWPETRAFATNSVATDFNPHPPDPRLYYPSDSDHQQDVTAFKELSKPFYVHLNDRVTDVVVKQLLGRSVTYNCQSLLLTGEELIYLIIPKLTSRQE